MKRKMKSNQSGRTIMEMIAYIMIMVTVTAAIAALVNTGYHRYECSMVQQELTDLKKLIVMRYAADGDYKKISWNDLRESHMGPRNIMPTRECKTKKCFGQHTFEGKIEIGTEEITLGADKKIPAGETFYIEFQELPADVCAQMGSRPWPSSDGSDLERLEINGNIWTFENLKKDGEKILQTRASDVIAACNPGYDNKIKWTFN